MEEKVTSFSAQFLCQLPSQPQRTEELRDHLHLSRLQYQEEPAGAASSLPRHRQLKILLNPHILQGLKALLVLHLVSLGTRESKLRAEDRRPGVP